jgi:hypothetical protein
MITVLSKDKPSSVVAEATARVRVAGNPATRDEVIDAGLRALGETRTSLFGFGVRDGSGLYRPDVAELAPGEYTVYAWRD